MKKILWLIIAAFFGYLIAEILRRDKMQQLQVLEAKEARRKATNDKYKREWQREFANMPFDERMEYELFEAGLKLDGYIKDDDDEESD